MGEPSPRVSQKEEACEEAAGAEEERQQREQAEADAKRRAEEEHQRREQEEAEARQAAEEERQRRQQEEAEAKRRTVEEERQRPAVPEKGFLRRIQDEINRAFGDQRWIPSAEFPPINVWRGPDGIIVTAEIPGVQLDAIDLTVDRNMLTIKGRREPEAKEPEAIFHRRERTFGPFTRTVALPFNVDANQVKASAQNGILTVHVPRPESDKPRKIEM